MNPDVMMKKAKAADFIANNGKILRAFNMIATDFSRLSSICSALVMDADDFAESINYLIEASYVRIRCCDTLEAAELADYQLSELEGKLTDKGISLLYGVTVDKCVEV